MAEFGGTRVRPPGIRSKWFVADETIGIGKIRLLETVGELGSISAAARQMGMGYKRAWFLIASLQQGFNAPLIETVRGGNTHGGAAITELGKELVRRFNAHEVEIQTGFAGLSEWLQTVQARAPVSGAPMTDAQVCESDANEAGVDEAGTEQQGGSDDRERAMGVAEDGGATKAGESILGPLEKSSWRDGLISCPFGLKLTILPYSQFPGRD